MIGGRNGWIAWPVGVLCVGVVAGLVWLARPAVPAVIGFIGNTLRAGAAATTTPQPTRSGARLTDDCRSLYPDGLWTQLSWQHDVVLSQSTTLPVTMAPSVRDALTPHVMMTCGWRNGAGHTVTTTVSRVSASEAALARDGFAAQGFTCGASGDGVQCVRSGGGTTETDTVRDGLWLSTTEVGWHPSGYTDGLVGRLWS